MTSIVTLGKILDPTDFQKYVEEAEQMETVKHRYGSNFNNIPKHPCWMEYQMRAANGTISFSRNTYLHPSFKTMIENISEILRPLLPDHLPPNPEQMHFIRTTGTVPVHRDEARSACINIGIKNSQGAITRVSLDGIPNNYAVNHYDLILEDGHSYLLDATQLHSVHALNNKPRYLISYSIPTMTFNDLLPLLKLDSLK